MKNALKIIKFLFVSFVWTILLSGIASCILNIFWDFNLFSSKGWSIIAKWWQRGGIINSWQDYLFFIVLFTLLPLWVLGIKRGMRINFVRILLAPIEYVLNHGLDEEPKSITIKNIDVLTHKTTKEEYINNIVEQRMKEMDENNPPEAEEKTYDLIRHNLATKK